jgi:hypothetical protein
MASAKTVLFDEDLADVAMSSAVWSWRRCGVLCGLILETFMFQMVSWCNYDV